MIPPDMLTQNLRGIETGSRLRNLSRISNLMSIKTDVFLILLYYYYFQVRFWIFHPVHEKQRDRNNSDVTHVRLFKKFLGDTEETDAHIEMYSLFPQEVA